MLIKFQKINIIDSLNIQGAINIENLFSAQNSNAHHRKFLIAIDSIRNEYRWTMDIKKRIHLSNFTKNWYSLSYYR